MHEACAERAALAMPPAPTAAEPAATAATALTCVSVPGWTQQEAGGATTAPGTANKEACWLLTRAPSTPLGARLEELFVQQPPPATETVSSSLARPMHHLDDLQVCYS